MSNLNVSLMILIGISGTGLFFMIAGFFILLFEKIKKNNCTAMAEGVVVKYGFSNNIPAPIVEYNVAGINYIKQKHFRGVITTTKQFSMKDLDLQNNSIYIDENDIVHIHRGPIMNLRKEAKRIYPIGSTLTVFYNQKKPKQAYVEKIPRKASLIGIIYVGVGLFCTVFGIIMSLLFDRFL